MDSGFFLIFVFYYTVIQRLFQPSKVYMDVNLLLLFSRRRVLAGLVFGAVWSGLLMFNCILQIKRKSVKIVNTQS